jgi:hypothetical protein
MRDPQFGVQESILIELDRRSAGVLLLDRLFPRDERERVEGLDLLGREGGLDGCMVEL